MIYIKIGYWHLDVTVFVSRHFFVVVLLCSWVLRYVYLVILVHFWGRRWFELWLSQIILVQVFHEGHLSTSHNLLFNFNDFIVFTTFI